MLDLFNQARHEARLDEFQRRILVLEWMQEKNITDFENVNKVINIYYAKPKNLLAHILGES